MDKTLIKGLRVLEILATYEEPVSVSELAAACNIAKSNAHRVLKTFLTMGYVTQEPATRRYRLTLRVWSLGSKTIERLDFKREAQPFLSELNKLSGETTHLSILDRYEVIYIDKLEAVHAVRTFTHIGGRAPAYCVATGRALLAYQSEDVIAQALAETPAFNNATETDPDRLRDILNEVSRSAIAINRGGWQGGAYGLAAPIFSAANRPVAAIGISAPRERMPEDRIAELAPQIVDIACRLSIALGATDLGIYHAEGLSGRSHAS